jgi:hypothetical protein
MCDFKKIPYKRDAILSALKKEVKAIEFLKQEFEKMPGAAQQREIVHELVDKSHGAKIMIDRLIKDFGMSDAQVRDYVGIKPLTMTQTVKMKLAYAAAKRSGIVKVADKYGGRQFPKQK